MNVTSLVWLDVVHIFVDPKKKASTKIGTLTMKMSWCLGSPIKMRMAIVKHLVVESLLQGEGASSGGLVL